MPVFDVKVRRGANVVGQEIVARDAREARALAGRNGVVVAEPKKKSDLFSKGMTPGERYVFLYQLATMAVAKVPLSEGLKTLRDVHGGAIGRCAASLEAGVAAGKQLTDLMVEDKRNFPGAVGLLVKAGSKGLGGTASALKNAAEFERDILNATTKGNKGIYAAGFWIMFSAIGCLALPMVLSPYMHENQLFKMTKEPINWDWLDTTSYWAGGFCFIFMVIGLFIFFIVGIGQRVFPTLSDKIVLRLPILRDIVFTRDNYISLYRFALMIKAGVTLEESLLTTWSDTRQGALRDDLRGAMDAVRTGRPWAEGFRTVSIIDRKALQMASDKERLGEILGQVADQNKALYVRRLEAMDPIMQVIKILGISVLFTMANLYSVVPFSQLFSKLLSGNGF